MDTAKELTIGMDLGDKTSVLCALTRDGKVKWRTTVDSTVEEITALFSSFPDPSQLVVAMEAGTHSPWISDVLEELGIETLVGNPRELRMIWASDRKSDNRDAEMLARLARSDRNLLYPIMPRGMDERLNLLLLKAREGLVKIRTELTNQIRGLVKSFGGRIPSCSPEAFPKVAREHLDDRMLDLLGELIVAQESTTVRIRAYDRRISDTAKDYYPQTERLRAIKGVGPITALAFVLIVGDPKRFAHSRDVGAYFGLVPKRDQSGACDKPLSISKAGNPMMRKLLVVAANYVMGPFGEDCDLRRHGEKIAAKGEQIAKRKAKTAVARKLSVLMHRLLVSGDSYDPFYNRRSA